MGSIYLIRHGQASFGKANYDELSSTGRRQAAVLGHFFNQCGLRFDQLISGTMERQQDTALLMRETLSDCHADALPLGTHDGFNEFDHELLIQHHLAALALEDELVQQFVASQIDRKKNFQAVFERVIARWVSGEHPAPGEEPWLDFCERVWLALQGVLEQAAPDANIAICTSGGPIAAIVRKLLNLDDTATFQVNWQIANASVTRLRFRDQNLQLSFFNQYAQFLSSEETGLLTFR